MFRTSVALHHHFLSTYQRLLRRTFLCVQVPPLEKPLRRSHWERKEQSLLAHQVGHCVIPKHSGHEPKSTASLLQGYRSLGLAICSGEVTCSDKAEGELKSCIGSDID